MKTQIKLFILIISLISCVNEKELLTKLDASNIKEKVEIDTTYSNENLNTYTYQSLVQLLNSHDKLKIFNDYKKLDDSLKVKLFFDGVNQLNVSYKDSSQNIISYTLKVKNKGNYLSLKRKVKLIPIPFIFFYYQNIKTIIYIDNENILHCTSGQNQFVWMILAGGRGNIHENKFGLSK